MKNKETAVNEEIEALNRIIDAAIDHGGDPGGPYFSDEETLTKSIMRYMTIRRLDGMYIVSGGNRPKIIKKG